MMNPIRSGYFVPGIHILFWGLLLFLIPALIFHNQNLIPELPHHFFLITNIYHVGLFYFNVYFLYPRLVSKKKRGLYLLAIAGILLISYYLKLILLRLYQPGFEANSLDTRILFFPAFLFLFASFIYSLVTSRIQEEKLEKEKNIERIHSELKFLRSQVSPHFLFNIMTNMVSLARQKSDQLEPALIQLSELLRYMLYEPEQKHVPVEKEIAYLKSYIQLQEMRFGENVTVQMESKIEDSDSFIEPMLLIPFVENAFKHGIGSFKNPFIHISITLKAQHLFFSVMNTYSQEKHSKDKSSGIGLENVQNRLKLVYPGRYRLDIEQSDEIFKIELNIDLL